MPFTEHEKYLIARHAPPKTIDHAGRRFTAEYHSGFGGGFHITADHPHGYIDKGFVTIASPKHGRNPDRRFG